jgi:hypothetical protein
MIELTVIDHADQKFGAFFRNQRVTMRLRYNTVSERWSYDLALDDKWIIHGHRITNLTNVFRGYGLNLGVLFAYPATVGAEPGRRELPGRLVRLFHVDDASELVE